MKVIGIWNRKGGVGKTTTAVNIIGGLSGISVNQSLGIKTLLFNTDGQDDVSQYLKLNESEYAFEDCFLKDKKIEDIITHDIRPTVDLITTKDDEGICNYLKENPRAFESVVNEIHRMNYDFCIVDCAPAVNILNSSVLEWVDELYIPISLEELSIVGLKRVFEFLIKNRIALTKVTTLVPNFYDSSDKDCVQDYNQLKDFIENEDALSHIKVLTPIKNWKSIKKLPKKGLTAFEYNKLTAEQFTPLLRRVVIS